jgi:hypothetical protein
MLQNQISCGIIRLPSAVGQVMITTGGVIGMFTGKAKKSPLTIYRLIKSTKKKTNTPTHKSRVWQPPAEALHSFSPSAPLRG